MLVLFYGGSFCFTYCTDFSAQYNTIVTLSTPLQIADTITFLKKNKKQAKTFAK